MNEDLAKKTYYTITEVSKMVEVEPYILRYWEKEFKEINPYKDKGGSRRYRKKDIEIIQKIKHLLYEQKFTTKGAKEFLCNKKTDNHLQKNMTDSVVLNTIKNELNEIKRELDKFKD